MLKTKPKLQVNINFKLSVKENMKFYLVGGLKEITNKLRNNEEEYMKKYMELVPSASKFGNNTFNPNLNSSMASTASKSEKSGGFLETDSTSEILRKRDVEINNLVSSITELAGIFKDLQSLVFEQGKTK